MLSNLCKKWSLLMSHWPVYITYALTTYTLNKHILTIHPSISFVIIDLPCSKYVMQVKLMLYAVLKFWYMKGDIITMSEKNRRIFL